jgi:hypothetical protein
VITSIGGEQQGHAKALGRLAEHPRLVPRRRCEKQNPFHAVYNRATCSAFGSAQQYQGSFR